MDVYPIFAAAKLTKSICEYLEIIESLDSKVDRLISVELNSAKQFLAQAEIATVEQLSILREARTCFTKAISLEKGLRQAESYLGLALCHKFLNDEANCQKSLLTILEINPVTKADIAKAVGLDLITGSAKPSPNVSGYPTVSRNHFFLGSNPIMFALRMSKKSYRQELVIDAMNLSHEASSIFAMQQGVSAYLGEPIPWFEEAVNS